MIGQLITLILNITIIQYGSNCGNPIENDRDDLRKMDSIHEENTRQYINKNDWKIS